MTHTAQLLDDPTVANDRFAQFEQEVSKLKVSGGRSGADKFVARLSLLGMVVAVVLAVTAWNNTRSAVDTFVIADNSAQAMAALVIAIVCTGLYVASAMQRYLRFWMIRLIYEHRAQTDRLADVDA